jgi:hypothetical protein
VAQRPPNIVVILADDMGFNDVTTYGGGHGAQGVPTPAIDAIARDGVRFDRGYAGSAVCTVSRAALMTGRYPWRFGVQFTPTPGAFGAVVGGLGSRSERAAVDHRQGARRKAKGFDDLGMPASEQTLAELLKARGYHTVHIGKWHLGTPEKPEMRPNNQGFDESLYMEGLLYLPQNSPDVVSTPSRTSTRSTSSCGPTCAKASATTAATGSSPPIPDRLLHRRGGQRDPREPQPAVLAVPGALGRAHAAAGSKADYDALPASPTTAAGSTPPWCARSTAAWAGCCRRCASRAWRTTPS